MSEALCSASVTAAQPSLTMTVRKFSIIASRALLSQQQLVTVPAISTVSRPRARSRSGRSEPPWMKAL